jgi:hypothetical protein
MAAAGLATLIAPVTLAQQPAGAASNTVTGSGSIDFVSYDGQTTEECTVSLRATHDTSANVLDAFTTSSGSGPACTRDVLFVLTLSMKDENGDLRHATGQAYNSVYVSADHAVSATSATVDAYFNDCSSSNCHLSVTVSPK